MSDREFLLAEIANPNRIEILRRLAGDPLTFTDLTKRMDLSSSEISRHLNRLTDQRLIEKVHPSRNFQLTSLGRLVVLLISPIEFIVAHVDYFTTHRATDLPESLIRGLDALQKAEMVSGTGLVMIQMEQIMKTARKSVDIMVETPFPWGTENLHARYIVPTSLLPFREKILASNASTDGRLLDHVSISLLIVDGAGGLIVFPDLQGKSDFNTIFVVSASDTRGCAFLKAVWDYFWGIGRVYS